MGLRDKTGKNLVTLDIYLQATGSSLFLSLFWQNVANQDQTKLDWTKQNRLMPPTFLSSRAVLCFFAFYLFTFHPSSVISRSFPTMPEERCPCRYFWWKDTKGFL